MFKIFKSKITTPSDKKIDEIANILFPPYEVNVDKDGTKYQIDYSADMNLDSALSDLEDGYNDQTVRNTIKDISNRLYKIRQIMEVYRDIEKGTTYMIVDTRENKEIEEIQAKDREY